MGRKKKESSKNTRPFCLFDPNGMAERKDSEEKGTNEAAKIDAALSFEQNVDAKYVSNDSILKSKSRRKRARVKKRLLHKEKLKRTCQHADHDDYSSCNHDDAWTSIYEMTNAGRVDHHRDGCWSGSEENDCYQKVMEGCLFPNGCVRSSWLKDVRPIQSLDTTNKNDTFRYFLYDDDCRAHHHPPQGEWNLLYERLHKVKRSLWPAAEECANARNRVTYNASDDCEDTDDTEPHTNKRMYVPRQQLSTPNREFERARRRCNPFEQLGEGQSGGLNRFFVNRSAMKLACIDALLGFTLTRPSSLYNGPSDIKHDEDNSTTTTTNNHTQSLLFVDLCGAPGGFSEYIFHRFSSIANEDTPFSCRGYGMSLLGKNEHGNGIKWKLGHMLVSTMLKKNGGNNNCHYRVCAGADGTGDIYNWNNVLALQYEIKHDLAGNDDPDCTTAVYLGERNSRRRCHDDKEIGNNTSISGSKVDLVMADGGFDAQRNADCQETLAHKLIATETAAALYLLKAGGTYVVKMYGFRNQDTRYLLRHLYQSFHEMRVLKPILSRPASSERYVVCIGYCPSSSPMQWNTLLTLREEELFGVMRGDTTKVSTVDCHHPHKYDDDLDSKLLEIDRDICILNIKACTSILYHLKQTTGKLLGEQLPTIDGVFVKETHLNNKLFEMAWKLY